MVIVEVGFQSRVFFESYFMIHIRHRFEPNYSEFQAVILVFAILLEGVAVHFSNYYFVLLKLVLLVLEHLSFEFYVVDILLLLNDFALVSFLAFGAPKIIVFGLFDQLYIYKRIKLTCSSIFTGTTLVVIFGIAIVFTD